MRAARRARPAATSGSASSRSRPASSCLPGLSRRIGWRLRTDRAPHEPGWGAAAGRRDVPPVRARRSPRATAPARRPSVAASCQVSQRPRPRRTARRATVLRPRWQPDYQQDACSPAGRTAPSSRPAHSPKRQGRSGACRWPTLAAGAYRLRYETTDEFGAKATAWREFVVGSAPRRLSPLRWLAAAGKIDGSGRRDSAAPGAPRVCPISRCSWSCSAMECCASARS